MYLFKRLQKASKKESNSKPVKYFESIDQMPIYNWFEVINNGELKYLIVDEDLRETEKLPNGVEIWEKLYNQFVDRFGFTKSYKDYLKKHKELILLQIESVYDKSQQTFVKVKEREIKILFPDKEGQEYLETMALLEKHLGFLIDPKKMSVAKYYTHIRIFNKLSESTKAKTA